MVRGIMFDIQTIYLYGLIIAGSLTLLYLLFGDIFHIHPGNILNPAVILSFFAILFGSGFAFELTTRLTSTIILLISTIISLILVSILHFCIISPLSKLEENTAYRLSDLIGKNGEITTTIPVDGLGEVLINTGNTLNGHMAKSNTNSVVKEGITVQVIGIEEGVLVVEPLKKRISLKKD